MIPKIANLITKIDKLEAQLKAQNTLSVPENKILSGTDLDSITTSGTYLSNNANISSSLLNCPVSSNPFKLIVENVTSAERYRQTIIVYTTSSITYVRTYTTTWGAWQKITTTEVS